MGTTIIDTYNPSWDFAKLLAETSKAYPGRLTVTPTHKCVLLHYDGPRDDEATKSTRARNYEPRVSTTGSARLRPF